MDRFPACALGALLVLLDPALGRADPFTIDLEAQAGKESKVAHAEKVDSKVQPRPRAVLALKVDTPITVKWKLTNASTTAVVKDVLVHFVAVKEEKLDQPAVPRLTKDVVAESAVTVDFQPKEQTEGDITFTIAKPGCYLLRLETKGAAGKDGHDYFAALDVVVR